MSTFPPQKTYTDQAFMQELIAAVTFACQAMPNQMIAIKDSQSILVYCSEYYAELMGSTAENVYGTKYWAACYNNDQSFEKIIMAEDQSVIQSREQKIVLKINQFPSGLLPYLCIKTPIINPSTDNVVGLMVHGLEMGALGLLHKMMQAPFSGKKPSAAPTDLPHLSKREKQVVFLFLANLSSQAIADLLYQLEGKKISKSTIDSVFNDQLYIKFNVHSRPALYKKLQDLGYENRIPQELLKNNSILLDKTKIY